MKYTEDPAERLLIKHTLSSCLMIFPVLLSALEGEGDAGEGSVDEEPSLLHAHAHHVLVGEGIGQVRHLVGQRVQKHNLSIYIWFHEQG